MSRSITYLYNNPTKWLIRCMEAVLNPRQEVRRLLLDMLSIVDSSSDALENRYAELRDGTYNLAVQVRTAAIPDPYARRDAFVKETTMRKW